jgi:predicted DNA-binding protein
MRVREVISFRLDNELLEMVKKIAEKLGCSKSEVLRLAVVNYIHSISDDEIKLLRQKYEKLNMLDEIKKEGKLRTWEAFYRSRFKRMMDKALDECLDVDDLIAIASSYRKEAEILGRVKDFENVMKIVFTKMRISEFYSENDVELIKRFFMIEEEDSIRRIR